MAVLAIAGFPRDARDASVIDTLFARVGFSPNESQRHAIEHLDGPLFLVAGPGSGKTRVLLWRVVNMIVFHGVAPESVFLSTFTEKAAKQLQDGLISLLGLAGEQTGSRARIPLPPLPALSRPARQAPRRPLAPSACSVPRPARERGHEAPLQARHRRRVPGHERHSGAHLLPPRGRVEEHLRRRRR